MRLRRHGSRFRALALGGAVLACLALPAVASADTTGGGTISPAASRGAAASVYVADQDFQSSDYASTGPVSVKLVK